MRKITDFIIDKRYYVLGLFIILSIGCAILSQKVTINYDIAKYLPNTSETRIGMDIMEDEFSNFDTSNLNVMFEDLNSDEKYDIKKYLENIDGVDEVEYDDTAEYNKDKYTLYIITVSDKSDSKLAASIYDNIIDKYSEYTVYTSGAISDSNEPILPLSIIALAVFCALIILIIMCDSYFEPFLFLLTILIAIILNNGTNLIFDSVSYITSSISAILQLALSMDYSIMLMNRYSQEKEKNKNKIVAMKNALHNAFQSISSSSITTIVGLLALVFMSFTIGKDLGFVLAKGVLFSLICIFTCLPAFILMFDRWITKTKKKSPIIKLNTLGKISYKLRYVGLFLFLVIFIGSFILKGNLGFDYTNSEEDEISKVFKENNQMAIIYQNKDEDNISKYLNKIENYDKVDEVLAYGNTINQKLIYNQLNSKLKDLNSNVDIEDYLLKIIYYNYYNKNIESKMTFEEFINFIETQAYNNEKINEKIDDSIKNDINRLKNFTSISNMNNKMSISAIASILEIDEDKANDLIIYYLSKYGDIQISLKEFVDFMYNDVLTNEKYKSQLDSNSISLLEILAKFTNIDTISQKMTSDELAEMFEIDYNAVSELYKYYININKIDLKLSIQEFTNFVLNNVITDSNYVDSFDDKMIENLKLLTTFSNLDMITKDMNSKELEQLFGIEENKITQLLLLKYLNEENNNTLTLNEFISNIILLSNTPYLNNVDVTQIKSLELFTHEEIISKPMAKEELKNIFDTLDPNLVDMVYLNLPSNTLLSPYDFINLVITNLTTNNSDENTVVEKLELLQLIMNETMSDEKTKYSSNEIANIFKMNSISVNQIYNLIDYNNKNTANWVISPSNFVELILQNKDNENIKTYIDDNTIVTLNLLSKIMYSTINQEKYLYQDLAKLINIDEGIVKSIYTLYISFNNTQKLTPQEFINFILDHQNDEVLKNSIPIDTINNLNLLKKIIDNVLANTRYNYYDLANLLNINNDKLQLLYGLYNSKYISQDFTISMREFINFILNDVITNQEYSKNFTEDKIIKLNTVNEIMNSVINSTKYSCDEIFTILTKLANDIDKNMIEVLYIYYGSNNEYNEMWTMTIEQFVDYLNKDILTDDRFQDFIDDDMKQQIIDAKDTIKDAKELLIGNKYSRIVINTKYEKENEETFDFIQEIDDTLSNDIDDFYIIGDSPMAYDMSKSFSSELDYITVITMIVIFIVVAFTFKSIIIPVILVLTIQCAVYLTMGILSFSGDNVYFIAILIVQSILMGATIDYAILYTSYYIEHRQTMDIKNAIINSYNKSIHTILTSASILTIVTLIVGHFASAIAAKICITISEGTICSSILILILLPAVIATFDKIIIKNKKIKKS